MSTPRFSIIVPGKNETIINSIITSVPQLSRKLQVSGILFIALAAIETAVRDFNTGGQPADDLTMLALKRSQLKTKNGQFIVDGLIMDKEFVTAYG